MVVDYIHVIDSKLHSYTQSHSSSLATKTLERKEEKSEDYPNV